MFDSFKKSSERLLRIPHDPEPPPGDAAATRIFRAAPNFYRYLFLFWAVKSLVTLLVVLISGTVPLVIAAIALFKQKHPSGLLLLLVPAVALTLAVAVRLFLLAVLRLEYEKRWYVVSDRSLRIREGVVTVREMTVNFANIQNISISQGPIQRALGIADLRVETAGGGGGASRQENSAIENLHTARFRGINNATEVRQLIQDRLRHLKDSGLGDHEELSTPAWVVHSSAFVSALREVHAEAVALRQRLT